MAREVYDKKGNRLPISTKHKSDSVLVVKVLDKLAKEWKFTNWDSMMNTWHNKLPKERAEELVVLALEVKQSEIKKALKEFYQADIPAYEGAVNRYKNFDGSQKEAIISWFKKRLLSAVRLQAKSSESNSVGIGVQTHVIENGCIGIPTVKQAKPKEAKK